MEILLNYRPQQFKIPSEFEDHFPFGLFLALEPQVSYDGVVHAYSLYLCNDTWDDVHIELLVPMSSNELKAKGKLSAMHGIELTKLSHQESLQKLECKATILHKHFNAPLIKLFSIHASSFVQHQFRTHLYSDRFFYQIMIAPSSELEKNPYYKKAREIVVIPNHFEIGSKAKPKVVPKRNELLERAKFQDSLDLHYDKIVSKGNPHILEDQIHHLEDYISQAIRYRFPKVRVIHGKGEGILKKRIQAYANDHPQILKYEELADGGSGMIYFKNYDG